MGTRLEHPQLSTQPASQPANKSMAPERMSGALEVAGISRSNRGGPAG